MTYTCNISTQEAEAGRPWVQGQHGLHSMSQKIKLHSMSQKIKQHHKRLWGLFLSSWQGSPYCCDCFMHAFCLPWFLLVWLLTETILFQGVGDWMLLVFRPKLINSIYFTGITYVKICKSKYVFWECDHFGLKYYCAPLLFCTHTHTHTHTLAVVVLCLFGAPESSRDLLEILQRAMKHQCHRQEIEIGPKVLGNLVTSHQRGHSKTQLCSLPSVAKPDRSPACWVKVKVLSMVFKPFHYPAPSFPSLTSLPSPLSVQWSNHSPPPLSFHISVTFCKWFPFLPGEFLSSFKLKPAACPSKKPVPVSPSWCSHALLLFCTHTHLLLLFCVCFETGPHCVAQSGCKLSIFPPQPPGCWDCRCTLPYSVYSAYFYQTIYHNALSSPSFDYVLFILVTHFQCQGLYLIRNI
jgi:hypothetical protein